MNQPAQGQKYTPRVSIGMPVFNGEPFIRKALDSLLAQTHTDFELIISDNASTDATAEICKEYAEKDGRIRYIRQPKNMEALSNFNFVLDQARSEYFMWAAADDIWHKNFLSKSFNYINNHGDIGVVFTKYWVTSRMYPLIKMRKLPNMGFLSNENTYDRISSYILVKESSHKANLFYGLWRRSIAVKMMEYSREIDKEEMCYGGDIAILMFILATTRAFQIQEVLFFKTYKRFPPGHILDLISNLIISGPLNKSKNQFSSSCQSLIAQRHNKLLVNSLIKAGVYNEKYREILLAKLDADSTRYKGFSRILCEFVSSLKVGIC